MPSEPQDMEKAEAGDAHAGALVPFHAGIVRGVQAIRQGQAILYTVRGEPKQVQELITQLDADGVEEVIAVISHETRDETADNAACGQSEDSSKSEPGPESES